MGKIIRVHLEDVTGNLWDNLTDHIDSNPEIFTAEESYAEDIAKYFGNGVYKVEEYPGGYRDWFEITEEDWLMLNLRFG